MLDNQKLIRGINECNLKAEYKAEIIKRLRAWEDVQQFIEEGEEDDTEE